MRVIAAVTPDPVREVLGASWRRLIYRPRVEPSQQFMRELRHRFKGEVEAVSEYLGRDLLTLWGYDRLS